MNFIKYTFLFLLIGGQAPFLTAQKIDVRLAGRNDCAANSYCATIQLKATSGTVQIGTTDFLVTYETSALSYKGFTAINLDKLYHPNSAWDYCAMDGYSRPGWFHLTAELLNTSGANYPVPSANWLSVGTICFDVVDRTVNPKILFEEANVHLNRKSPNDGTYALPIQNLTGIDRDRALNCDHHPEVFYDFVGEAGSVFTHQPNRDTWHSVQLKKTYKNPVVVANLSSFNGGDPAHIRVRNISANGFEFKIEEWDYSDGGHTSEKVDYVVVEQGYHQLTDGTIIQAGLVEQNFSWRAHPFSTPFAKVPTVMSQVVDDAFPHAVVTRMKGINKNKFDLHLQSEEEKMSTGGAPTSSKIAWIACEPAKSKFEKNRFWETGNFGNKVNQDFSTHRFKHGFHRSTVLIGQMQSVYGGDVAGLRFDHLTSKAVEIKVEEEKSRDDEINHNPETIGYFLFEEGMLEAEWRFGSPPDIIGEAGKLKITQDAVWKWQPVVTKRAYENPVVVVQVNSENGGDPLITRVRKIHERRFDIMLQEWEYLDGTHLEEEVSWIVMEAGSYVLPNGKMIQAGSKNNMRHWFKSVNFAEYFNETPVVTAQINGGNSWKPVSDRLRNITYKKFEVKLTREEQAMANNQYPAAESIDYIAAEPMNTSMSVRRIETEALGNDFDHIYNSVNFAQSFSGVPVVVGEIQTNNGGDVSELRMKGVTKEKMELKIEEEQSKDDEISHAKEEVGFLAFEEGAIAAFQEDFQPCVGKKGEVLMETWYNVNGHRLNNLYNSGKFPNQPDFRETSDQIKREPYFGNRYGTRVQGYISPPFNGYFTFNITGDDQTSFYLSSDANPANADRKAFVNGWTQPTQHHKYGSQTSEKIYLSAGRLYYFDIHHKEGGGGDHFELFWKWGNNNFRSIDNRFFYNYECGAQSQGFQTINFEVANNGTEAQLYWYVENEWESDFFEVQTAENLSDFAEDNFEVLGTEEGSGAGVADQIKFHRFSHNIQAEAKSRYYRIMQSHLDGTVSYSAIRSIFLDRSDELIHVYPNPFVEKVTVVFPDKLQPKDSQVRIILTDGLGRELFIKEGDLEYYRVFEFELGQEYKDGIYQISAYSDGYRMMARKIVKVH